jgi:hypothetical protein
MTADPFLLLASAIATFDPFWRAFDDDEMDYDADPLHLGLCVSRSAFPDIYAEMVCALSTGADYNQLDSLLCKAISAKGIPLDELEMIGWGIPFTPFGVDLDDPQFYSIHQNVLPALEPLGILPPINPYTSSVPQAALKVGCAIALSLHQQTDPVLHQLSYLYGWLFGCTGNSLVDSTDEMLGEIPPLSWSPDDVAFAIEMIQEADDILNDAYASLETLLATPELMQMLDRNVDLLYRELAKRGDLHEHSVRLEWTYVGSGVERNTIADAELLLIRRDAA